MLMTEKQVSSSLDQHSVKLSNEAFAINKNGTESKNLTQPNGDISTSSSVPYNTLSLGRKTKRGISQLSEEDVVQPPSLEEKNGECKKEPLSCFTVDTPEYTLILPDINTYPPDFRDFLKRDLLETSTLISLEHAGRLNWWVDLGICRRLFPLVTIGDGNCLLHAASLALTGVHDSRLILRKALSKMMCNSPFKNAFFRRWRWHQTILNKQSELVFTEVEWMEEWNNLAKLASTQPRVPSQPSCEASSNLNSKQRQCEECDEMEEILYESLEEFHVFILAHVLKRTIIIIADTILKNLNGEPLAPISFGGIYLPLECSPNECHKPPLLLTYDAAHFSALVPMEDDKDATNLADAVPLVDPDFELLPVHFAYDPGAQFQWSTLDDNCNVAQQTEQDLSKLLQTYMDVKFLSVPYAGEFEQKLDKKAEKDHAQVSTKDKTCDCSQSGSAAFNFSDSTGNSTRTCSSQSSPEENSVESSKSDADCSQMQTSSATKSLSKSKKLSSIKKRISKTFKMGFCASGQQEADEINEKKCESSNGSQHLLKKAKSVEDNKESKTISPGIPKVCKSGESLKTEIRPDSQGTNEIISSLEINLNTENVRPQLAEVLSKQDNQPLTQLKCHDRVLCARLYHKRDENQDRILGRYFAMAEERFQQFKKDDRRENQGSLPTACHLDPHQTSAGFSQPSLYPNGANKPVTMQCINAGCMGMDACAETSYLCRDCFERQKQEEIDMTLKMSSSKQIQASQPHQTKYLSSSPSSSSSTIQLPLIKNPNPVNSQFTGYKHVSSNHQQNFSSVNCYQKPTQLFQPMKSHVITSSSGAAAFNKSFESNFRENCIVSPSGTSYVGSSYAGPVGIIPQSNVVKHHGTNLMSSKVICSPIRSGEAPSSAYARSRMKHLQAIDSPLATMYASEEEDNEDEEDGILEDRNRIRKLTSQSKIISHESTGCILGKNNQKLVDPLANKSRLWDNGFRSSSFDDNNCHSHSTTIATNVGPWISKTTACKTEGCPFYGTANSDYFCSRCYKQKFGDYDMSLGIPANKSIVL